MLNTGIFPDKLKQSYVTPIFKANDIEFLSNYRPIFVIVIVIVNVTNDLHYRSQFIQVLIIFIA